MWKVYEHEEHTVTVEVLRSSDLKHIENSKTVYPRFYTIEDREAGPTVYYRDDAELKQKLDRPARFTAMADAIKVCANLLLLAKGDNRNDIGG